MNCKPGDLAVIVRDAPNTPTKTSGLLVDVLYAAETGGIFLLPDMTRHAPCPSAYWVVQFQSQVVAPMGERMGGGFLAHRICKYGCMPDFVLRPIRPQSDDATDEMVALLGKPQEVTCN